MALVYGVRFTLLVLILAGCATGIEHAHFNRLDQHMRAGMHEEAAREVFEAGRETYGDVNKLLYHMDLGYTLHLAGRYDSSVEQFLAADKLAADLYTQSLSAEAASLFTNDLSQPYQGERFELALINVFNALNYLRLGRLDDALVEIRRLGIKFQAFERVYEGRYTGDPFGGYVSALLYWLGGAWDDAFIAANRAFALYQEKGELFQMQAPRALARDIVRWGRILGRDVSPEVQQLAGDTPDRQSGGEIIVLHHFGPGPRKIERVIEMSVGKGYAFLQAQDVRSDEQKDFQRTLSVAKGLASTTQITIAYPVFEQPPLECVRAHVAVEGCGTAEDTMVENISAIAKVALEDRMKHEWGRHVARAIAKFVTARIAGQAAKKVSNNNSAVGLLAQVFTQAALSATEEADTRNWYTLPAQIRMSRVYCPPGTYTVRITQFNNQGMPLDGGVHPDIQVQDGDKIFIHSGCF